MTDFAIDRPEYADVWKPTINETAGHGIRAMLQAGKPQIVILQPGDGTRYRFLFVPAPPLEVEVSAPFRDEQRHPQAIPSPSPGAIIVTVLDGLGNGAATIRSTNGIDGIRHRIADKMEIRNACTAEALAQTVLAVWGGEPE